jgi:hypothetical protein
VYIRTFPAALFGVVGDTALDSLECGIAIIVALLIIGAALRGQAPRWALVVALATTVVSRTLFHAWYEADNPEWLIMQLALGVAGIAALAEGAPATTRAARYAGLGLCITLTVTAVYLHGPSTNALRDRKMMASVQAALDDGRDHWRVIAHGGHIGGALTMLAVPHTAVPQDVGDAFVRLAAELDPGLPTLVITDRFALDGMPATVSRFPIRMAIDDLTDAEGVHFMRHHGLVFAVQFNPRR